MTAAGQLREYDACWPNDRFQICKRTLAKDTMNGRYWPIPAVWQSEPLRSGLGQLRKNNQAPQKICFWVNSRRYLRHC